MNAAPHRRLDRQSGRDYAQEFSRRGVAGVGFHNGREKGCGLGLPPRIEKGEGRLEVAAGSYLSGCRGITRIFEQLDDFDAIALSLTSARRMPW